MDERKVFAWHGRDPLEDTNRLADAVAEAAVADIFNLDGVLITPREGQAITVTKDVLREIVGRYIASIRYAPKWESELFAFDFAVGGDPRRAPNEATLLALLNRSRQEGGLLNRVIRGPSTPCRLTSRQAEEVLCRLKQGEPQGQIADAYRVDEDVIQQLARYR